MSIRRGKGKKRKGFTYVKNKLSSSNKDNKKSKSKSSKDGSASKPPRRPLTSDQKLDRIDSKYQNSIAAEKQREKMEADYIADKQREKLADYISEIQGNIAQNHPTPKIPTVTNKQVGQIAPTSSSSTSKSKQIASTSSYVKDRDAKASINKKKRKPTKNSIMKSKTIKKGDANALKQHLFIFRHIAKGSAKKRDLILAKAPSSFYKTIRLLFKLLKNGSIPLKKTHRPRVRPWIDFIRRNSKGRLSDVKSDVSQQGTGLMNILKTVLPIVTPILSMLI